MSDQGLTVFNGRYALLRRIARGGMADVYLARDASLDRQVAVKVLFPEFANDPSFVERFRREAKGAANLSHPNIVGIFDWGQEQGTYYIVMEYVVGRSMADVLRSTGPLSPDRAAEIARDVAEALGSAHSAGLVHRDVKLGNIIVSDDGQVKVADFGIATALARRTGDNLTQLGSVMGTATYFSPEQARGKSLDGRSDLYSLGVVLYEMIVGKPPFAADTATAVAVKHVQERPLPPSVRGAAVPQSLEAIILKLLAKNPVNRYPKAEDLCADLGRYLSGRHEILPGPASASTPAPSRDLPAVKPGPTSDRAAGAGPEPPTPSAETAARSGAGAPGRPPAGTGAAPPTGPGAGSPAGPDARHRSSRRAGPGARHRSSRRAGTGIHPRAGPGAGPASGSGSGAGAGPPGGPVSGHYEPPAYLYEEVHRSDGWKRTTLMLLGLAVLVSVLVFLAVNFYRTLGLGGDGEPAASTDSGDVSLLEVPDVVGLEAIDAQAQLRAEGLQDEVSYEINTEVPENVVFRQSPPAGQRVDEGSTVLITISQAEESLVPPVRGRNSTDARELLTAAGYSVIALQGPSQAEAGIVVAQEPPAGAELPQGEAVTITISTGPAQMFVPDVRGQPLVDAFQALNTMGLRVDQRREPSDTVPEGEIIDTDPTANSPVGPGSLVVVVISAGQPLVPVPVVTGLLFDTGRLALERERLVIGIVRFEPVEPGSADVGRIIAQSPPANVEVRLGTPIDLIVGELDVPVDLAPADTVPADLGPADTVPVDLGPADTVPVDLGPADTAPAGGGDDAPPDSDSE